jgi:5'-nucleotidase
VAAGAVARLVQQVAQRGLDHDILLNVNVPSLPYERIKGVQVTRLGHRVYQDKLIERLDPRGRKYYWMGGTEVLSTHEEGTDATACEHGYISITPIHLDLTNHKLLDRLRSWDLRF